jgi:group I intron endonuclease
MDNSLDRKRPGVYMIHCFGNGSIYVGSSKNIEKRLSDHKSQLRHNYHKQQILQSTWNKYGESSFVFLAVAYCDSEIEYLLLEQQLLDAMVANSIRVMNIAAVTANPRLGRPGRRENGVHVGQSNRGVPKSAEHRAKTGEKRRAWCARNRELYGTSFPPSTMTKMSHPEACRAAWAKRNLKKVAAKAAEGAN